MFRIYLTTYNKYNSGSLGGEWITLPTAEKKIYDAFKRVGGVRWFDIEFMIADTETDLDFRDVSESESVIKLNKEIKAFQQEQKATKKANPDMLELIEEYKTIKYPNDFEMQEYCISKISNAYKLECGLIVEFEKQSIEKSFCFSEGINGMYDEGMSKAAWNMTKRAKEKDYFFAENLSVFDKLEKMIEGQHGFDYYIHRVSFSSKCGWIKTKQAEICGLTGYSQWMERVDQEDKQYSLTQKDISGLKRVCGEEREKMKKRLDAWWKRFGSEGIRTWTYLQD